MTHSGLQISAAYNPNGLAVVQHLNLSDEVLEEMAVTAELALGFRGLQFTGDFIELARLAVGECISDWTEKSREERQFAEVWRGARKWKVSDVVATYGISAKVKLLADQCIGAAKSLGGVDSDNSGSYDSLISL